MGAIKTSIPIELEVDDVIHTITLRDPNRAEKEEIEAIAEEHAKQLESVQTLMFEIEMLRREFQMNSEMIKDADLIEKITLIKENKNINRTIHDLSKSYNKQVKLLGELEDEAEAAYEKRFALLVSGAGKVELEKVIAVSGLQYSVIFKHIEESITKSREKK